MKAMINFAGIFCVFAILVSNVHGQQNIDGQALFPFSFFSKMLGLLRAHGPRLQPPSPILPYQPQMVTRMIKYTGDDGQDLIGYIAYMPSKVSASTPRPAVLIVHDWNGRDEYENRRARDIADLGYVGYALDIYGKTGSSIEENRALTIPYTNNRTKFVERIRTGMKVVGQYPFVDSSRFAAMGYCFGGSGVLDAAFTGMNLKGVASFHGTLSIPPEDFPNAPIKSKILIMTGYDDPMIKPQTVADFESELTKRKADWEVNSYSNTVHSFTNPSSNVPGRAIMYNAQSDRRSWARMTDFYKEIFNELGEI